MYEFELVFRVKVSPIGVLHHVGTIVIAQATVAISLNENRERDAAVEFILATVWGAYSPFFFNFDPWSAELMVLLGE